MRNDSTTPTSANYRIDDRPPATGMGSPSIVDDTSVLRRQVTDLHHSTRDLHRDVLRRDLNERKVARAKNAPRDMLNELSGLGFAWRDIARMVGVSVPAVQKWRRGDRTSAENRLRLATLLALVDMLQVRLVNEPASWMEMRLREGVALTPIDVVAAGRHELVLDLAEHGAEAIDSVFDEFDPSWRTSRVDDAFETYVAPDGIVSIRPRS